jgi:eukaryotic-like serine/threonine-protein kinase
VSSPLQLGAGAVIGGDYRIVRLLNSGGMGAVYVAEQISTEQLRAVKVMHPQLARDERFRERFVQEARVGARIASAHVVQVIGAGVDPATAMPWLAMELLEGEDLGAVVRRRGPLPVTEVIEILRQICHALGTAHAAGIVHRDVKPENIFQTHVRSTTSPVTIKVLDFGIAKMVATATGQATAAVGTPLWMAPEQSDPRSIVSPASDVWALGLVAFWLVTGRVYWLAASEPGASMEALLREILFEPLASASQRAAQLGVGAPVPPGFDAWLAGCLVREPRARFPDATVAMDAILEPGRPEAPRGAPIPSYVPASGPVGSAPGSGTARLPSPPRGPEPPPAEPPPPAGPPPPPASEPLPGLPAATRPAPTLDPPTPPASGTPAVSGRKLPGTLARVIGASATIALCLWVGVRVGARLPQEARLASVAPSPEVPRPSGSALASGERAAPPAARASSAQAAGEPSASASAAGSAGAGRRAHPRQGEQGHGAQAGGAPPPRARPFDRAAAARSVELAVSAARMTCSNMQGPRTIVATITFEPGGNVKSVAVDTSVIVTGAGSCTRGVLHSARVQPYTGGPESEGVAVLLQ